MINSFDFIKINFEYGTINKFNNFDNLIIDTNYEILINDDKNQENINKLLLENQYIYNSILTINNTQIQIDIKDIKKIDSQLIIYYNNIGKYEIPKFLYNGFLKFNILKMHSIYLLSSVGLNLGQKDVLSLTSNNIKSNQIPCNSKKKQKKRKSTPI